MKRPIASVIALSLGTIMMMSIAGCAGRTLQISGINYILTSEESLTKGKKIPTAVFGLEDKISFHVYIKWDDPTQRYGTHSVVYNWYLNEKLVSTARRYVNFNSTPTELWTKRDASVLGPGHYKVEIAIDGQTVGATEFDIKQ